MAFFTTHSTSTMEREGWFRRFMARLGAAFEAQAYASSRRDRIEALEAKSDEELARMGVRRDEIAHYVFRDLFYT